MQDANSVEKALFFHEKKFPPMLPRILRVARAKNVKKTKSATRKEGLSLQNAESTERRPKVPSQVQSLTGRAHKLLGRAGAANLRAPRGQQRLPSRSSNGVAMSPGSISFEGFRASSSQDKRTQRMTGRKHNRPSNRSKEFRMRGRKKI